MQSCSPPAPARPVASASGPAFGRLVGWPGARWGRRWGRRCSSSSSRPFRDFLRLLLRCPTSSNRIKWVFKFWQHSNDECINLIESNRNEHYTLLIEINDFCFLRWQHWLIWLNRVIPVPLRVASKFVLGKIERKNYLSDKKNTFSSVTNRLMPGPSMTNTCSESFSSHSSSWACFGK